MSEGVSLLEQVSALLLPAQLQDISLGLGTRQRLAEGHLVHKSSHCMSCGGARHHRLFPPSLQPSQLSRGYDSSQGLFF